MELGKRLKEARLEAGLSQRQLCGDEITRNMLSQIENGSARPSMDTLRYLAGRLGKTVSFFLEEEAVTSPNQTVMERARLCFLLKDHSGVLQTLEGYRKPDDTFDLEYQLLTARACLELAREAADQGRGPYAAELLGRVERLEAEAAYCNGELRRGRLLLAARVQQRSLRELVGELPSLDEELLLRARAALEAGDARRAAALLEAVENRSGGEWNLLRGDVFLAQGNYRDAAACYHRAEETCPEKTAPLLERCYRELEDYKMAYYYACRQK